MYAQFTVTARSGVAEAARSPWPVVMTRAEGAYREAGAGAGAEAGALWAGMLRGPATAVVSRTPVIAQRVIGCMV
ncbi:hypothetical protein ACM01_20260 [Streptomyces viridochromogenes]|uniref:Uncharacterized protein n=1 Tax=Streptomyces viridochromogenes TaxID=1938 RepID=A0A0J8C5I2_STRVR|nr:hypothetical protein ACM01_20260 [Streptomyces viridochromogenes]